MGGYVGEDQVRGATSETCGARTWQGWSEGGHSEVCVTGTVPQQELGSDMSGLSYPEKYRRSRVFTGGLLGGIFLLRYESIGLTTS